MKLNEAIIKTRTKLQSTKLNKSGLNRFAGFSYYELSDFLPTLNSLMESVGINDIFTIEDGVAKLILIKEDESNVYKMPFVMFEVPKNKNGQPSMQEIQYLGALNTYYKRYLYMNAFGITDGEVIDSLDNKEFVAPPPSKATNEDKKAVWAEFSNICSSMGVDATEFLSSDIDMADKQAVYTEVRKWLKNEELLRNQLMVFRQG